MAVISLIIVFLSFLIFLRHFIRFSIQFTFISIASHVIYISLFLISLIISNHYLKFYPYDFLTGIKNAFALLASFNLGLTFTVLNYGPKGRNLPQRQAPRITALSFLIAYFFIQKATMFFAIILILMLSYLIVFRGKRELIYFRYSYTPFIFSLSVMGNLLFLFEQNPTVAYILPMTLFCLAVALASVTRVVSPFVIREELIKVDNE